VNSADCAAWTGAVATFAATLVALFKEEFVQWRRAPELKARVTLEPPHCHRTEMAFPPSPQRWLCFYLRIEVENTGRTRAELVEIRVAKIHPKGASGNFIEHKPFLPMNLTWSHVGGAVMDGISPGLARHCDLGYILQPDAPHEAPADHVAGAPWLTLSLQARSFTGGHLLPPGEYRIDLIVAGANCASIRSIVEFNLTRWYEEEREMFSKGVGLGLLR
jgi:hypothetical protein